VDFALFNIPGIAKSLMPDNERKHGGVAEPIRRFSRGLTPKRKEKIDQLRLCDFGWEY
jgi:hypothetical protein